MVFLRSNNVSKSLVMLLLSSVLFISNNIFCNAFVPMNNNHNHHNGIGTNRDRIIMYIEDWVADMIDGELYRQGNKKEYEEKWMEKNRAAMMHEIAKEQRNNAENLFLNDDEARENARQKFKDKKLALSDPAAYCADRCVSTGNCDVYEDYFELSPSEVLEFCNDCVLNEEDEEPCDIPEAFYNEDNPLNNVSP